MTALRPQGMSPAHASFVSIDIEDSFVFRWTYVGSEPGDEQTKATIKLYDGIDQVLKTFEHTGSDNQVEMGPFQSLLQEGYTYFWTVQTYGKDNQPSEVSSLACFTYGRSAAKGTITWSYRPEGNERVEKSLFKELKDNLHKLADAHYNPGVYVTDFQVGYGTTFPDSMPYNKDEISGTIYKTGIPYFSHREPDISIPGSSTASYTVYKEATGTSSTSYVDHYAWYEGWIQYHANWSPDSISYSDSEGYSGSLSLWNYSGEKPNFPSALGKRTYGETTTRSSSGTGTYRGIVSKTIPGSYTPGYSVPGNTVYRQDYGGTLVKGSLFNLDHALIDRLFTAKIIPSQQDQDTLQAIVDYIYNWRSQYGKLNVRQLFKNSLGAEDVNALIDWLMKVFYGTPDNPIQPEAKAEKGNMYNVYDATLSQSGLEDASIELRWKMQNPPSTTAVVGFKKVKPTDDVRYYECTFEYGNGDGVYASKLFFRPSEIDERIVRFTTPTGMQIGHHGIKIVAVDYKGVRSEEVSSIKSYRNDQGLYGGLKHFEVEYQRMSTASQSYNASGTWTRFYNGTDLSVTHNVALPEGKYFYRIRTVDDNETLGNWVYIGPASFASRVVPATPQLFRQVNATQNSVTLYWSETEGAKKYELWTGLYETKLYEGTGRSFTVYGLPPNYYDDYFVRAVNDKGAGKWASCVANTRPKQQ